jgi:hypothetical protein
MWDTPFTSSNDLARVDGDWPPHRVWPVPASTPSACGCESRSLPTSNDSPVVRDHASRPVNATGPHARREPPSSRIEPKERATCSTPRSARFLNTERITEMCSHVRVALCGHSRIGHARHTCWEYYYAPEATKPAVPTNEKGVGASHGMTTLPTNLKYSATSPSNAKGPANQRHPFVLPLKQ